jgi:hypothetical protein
MVCTYVLVNSHFTENPLTWSCLIPIILRWRCYNHRAWRSPWPHRAGCHRPTSPEHHHIERFCRRPCASVTSHVWQVPPPPTWKTVSPSWCHRCGTSPPVAPGRRLSPACTPPEKMTTRAVGLARQALLPQQPEEGAVGSDVVELLQLPTIAASCAVTASWRNGPPILASFSSRRRQMLARRAVELLCRLRERFKLARF